MSNAATLCRTTTMDVTIAEFRKIYGFCIPQIAYACIAAFLSFFAVQLVYVEHMLTHVHSRDFTVIIPYLYFASWKTLLFLLFITAFSAYCVAVDSQYGMIRIGCVQPISRSRYLCGKSIAIQLHVALFALVYVASLVLWVGVYTGFSGVSVAKVLAVTSVALRTVLLCVGLSGCATAISFLRRTLLDAVVSSYVFLACCGLLTTLPTRFHLEPFLLLRYFFFPIAGIVPEGWLIDFPMRHASVWMFLVVCLATPLACFVPALLIFRHRDISE